MQVLVAENAEIELGFRQADAPASPAECSVFATLVDRINAQRAVNGKKPFALADLHTLRAEAAKAHITPIQAAQWVLERPSRNFFRADYFVPTACAPEAPTAPVKPQPVPTPPPAPLTPEAQAAQAEMVAQARAKAIAIVEAMRANKPATGIVPTSDIDVANLRGPQFAVDIVQSYMRGEHVALRPLELACVSTSKPCAPNAVQLPLPPLNIPSATPETQRKSFDNLSLVCHKNAPTIGAWERTATTALTNSPACAPG